MRFATGLIVLLSAVACTSTANEASLEQVGSTEPVHADELPGDDHRPIRIEEIQALFSIEDYSPDFQDWYFRGGDYARYIFLNPSEFWLTSTLSPAGEVRLLPEAYNQEVASLTVKTQPGETTVANYVSNSNIDGAIVVHKGKILFEDYPRMSAGDLHIWFSVSKTFVSTAVAILEDQGLIDANEPIETYLTDLQGTAWEGIRIIDILDMASGIDCPERHQERDNCFWSFYAGLGWPQTDRTEANPWDAYKSMGRARAPGESFEYTSINTELLNRLVTFVSGQRFADFVEANIWQRMGARSAGQLISTRNGNAFSAGGAVTTLRDLARYGLLFTPSGRKEPDPVISDSYLAKIHDPRRYDLYSRSQREARATRGDDSFSHNSYQWDWVSTEGDFSKGGAGGQGLYVSPSRDLVIAWFGTPDEDGRANSMSAIARQLATSDLFGE